MDASKLAYPIKKAFSLAFPEQENCIVFQGYQKRRLCFKL